MGGDGSGKRVLGDTETNLEHKPEFLPRVGGDGNGRRYRGSHKHLENRPEVCFATMVGDGSGKRVLGVTGTNLEHKPDCLPRVRGRTETEDGTGGHRNKIGK